MTDVPFGQVTVIAVPEGDGFIIECSVCGPVHVVHATDVDLVCRGHLAGHGITGRLVE